MSLSNQAVIRILSEDFVCGWRNIAGEEKYAGKSKNHEPSNPAVTTTNGAGSHNIQMLIVSPEQRVLHCLPGYWGTDALISELNFATRLFKLSRKPMRASARNDAFLLAHLNHACQHSVETIAQSKLQGFDQSIERRKNGDFVSQHAGRELKTVDQVVHERMAELPYLHLKDFSIATFANVGQKFYDAHKDCEHSRPPVARNGATVVRGR